MLLEPGQLAAPVVGAVLRPAVEQEQVVGAWVTHELGLAAGLDQRDEQLLALPDRAALVRLAMNDQRRRHGAMRELARRVFGIRLAMRLRRTAELQLAEDVPDVAG